MAGDDVKMEDAKKAAEPVAKKEQAAKEPAKPALHPRVALYQRLREELAALEAAVRAMDTVLIGRVVRYTNTLRKHLHTEALQRVVREFVPATAPGQAFLLKLVEGAPAAAEEDVDMAEAKTAGDDAEAEAEAKEQPSADLGEQPAPRPSPVVEVEAYLQVLVGLLLLDRGATEDASRAFADLVGRVPPLNRRTLDLVAARAYYYYALCSERLGRLRGELPFLLAAHRTACLHHDEPSQTVLTNAVLRLYLNDNLYAQADKFRLNTKLPESASPNEVARHLYYTGRINAVQLHYSDALFNLTQALRKGPQKGAVGFRQQAQKLLCIVQLLMGDIPERAVFREGELAPSLVPYYKLTHAVHVGSLADFKAVMAKFHDVFVGDKNYALIVRLRQNVIKTGLRKINLSYSRISIADVCSKLLLESVEAAEFVVAKAIHDGVIDATIDHKAGVVYSKENMDVYSTQDPQSAFHRRIEFCNTVHNDAVKALRFPAKAQPSAEEDAPRLIADDVDLDEDSDDEGL